MKEEKKENIQKKAVWHTFENRSIRSVWGGGGPFLTTAQHLRVCCLLN